jgi:hypothetical protein
MRSLRAKSNTLQWERSDQSFNASCQLAWLRQSFAGYSPGPFHNSPTQNAWSPKFFIHTSTRSGA